MRVDLDVYWSQMTVHTKSTAPSERHVELTSCFHDMATNPSAMLEQINAELRFLELSSLHIRLLSPGPVLDWEQVSRRIRNLASLELDLHCNALDNPRLPLMGLKGDVLPALRRLELLNVSVSDNDSTVIQGVLMARAIAGVARIESLSLRFNTHARQRTRHRDEKFANQLLPFVDHLELNGMTQQ
jgi:hypothetical protein